MGWFCRCRTMGASLLETNWCMAKSVVKLCSLKWWHNEWYNTFFYSNLLNEHPPEKKCQHWPCKRHSLFLLPRTAGSLSIPCDKLPLGWCVFLQDFRLKFVHYKIGHRVTIMSGASVTRYRKMEGWWIWRSGFFVRFVLPKWAESTFSATWSWTLALKKPCQWVSDSTSHYIVKWPDWWNTFSFTQMVWFPFNPQTGLFGLFSHAPCTLVYVFPSEFRRICGLISCSKKLC